VCSLVVELIKLVDPEFSTTPMEIKMNPRYMSHFKVKNNFSKLLNNGKGCENIFTTFQLNGKLFFFLSNCIGAINGTHVCVCVSQENQIPFIERKCVPTQNIMATCSLNMQFTFVWAG
jgi:hypothetical protein